MTNNSLLQAVFGLLDDLADPDRPSENGAQSKARHPSTKSVDMAAWRKQIEERLTSVEDQLVDMENYGFGAPEGEPLREYTKDGSIDLRDSDNWEEQVQSLWAAFLAGVEMVRPGVTVDAWGGYVEVLHGDEPVRRAFLETQVKS